MEHKTMISKYIPFGHWMVWGVFFAVLIVFGLCTFYTPLYWDDYMHGPLKDINHQYTGEVISSWADCLHQSIYYYWYGNEGRFLINALIPSALIYMLPSYIMNSAHVIVWVLLSYGLAINVLPKEQIKNKHLVFVVMALCSLLFFTLQVPKENTFFWKMGAFNYMWAGMINLFYFYLVEKKKWSIYAMIPISFIAGATTEAYAVPMGLMLAITFLIKPNWRTFWMGVFVALGAATIILAPSTLARLQQARTVNGSYIYNVIRGIARVSVYAHLFDLVVIWIAIWFVRHRASCLLFLKKNIGILALLLGFIFVNCFAGISNSSGPRMYFPLQLFSAVFLVRLYGASEFSSNTYKYIQGALLVLFVGVSVYWISYSVKRYRQITLENNTIRHTTDGVVLAEDNYIGVNPNSSYNKKTPIVLGQKLPISGLRTVLYHELYLDDTFCDTAQEISPNVFYKPSCNDCIVYKLSADETIPTGFNVHVGLNSHMHVFSVVAKYIYKNSVTSTVDCAPITTKQGHRYVVARLWNMLPFQVITAATPIYIKPTFRQ